jgi:endoglycosylceramidase
MLVACGGGEPQSDPPDRWHVADSHLRDPQGRAVVLRGANVSNRHKSAPYFDFHTQPDFELMRADWGMNTVRFLISWAAIEPEKGVYDQAYLDAVAERMAWIEAAGLHVVLDMHQDLYGEGFNGNGAPVWTCEQSHYDAYVPTTPWFANYANEHVVACYDQFWASEELLGHYAEAWRRVAARLAASPAVIGFDPMNEPYWGSAAPSTFEEESLAGLYRRVVAAVRQEAPDWVAFLEPSSSRNLGIATSLPAFEFADVVYSPHSYDSMAEAGEGFDVSRREAIVTSYDLFRQEADWLGAALWIGEMGGIAADGGIGAYMDAQYDGAARVVAGTTYWHFGKDGGYGILEADGSEKPELMGALVRPYPERIAGEPVSFAYDESDQTFTLTYVPDPGLEAPTVIVLPDRLYGAGAIVDCGGCEHVREGNTLRLVTPATGDPALVTVRP